MRATCAAHGGGEAVVDGIKISSRCADGWSGSSGMGGYGGRVGEEEKESVPTRRWGGMLVCGGVCVCRAMRRSTMMAAVTRKTQLASATETGSPNRDATRARQEGVKCGVLVAVVL